MACIGSTNNHMKFLTYWRRKKITIMRCLSHTSNFSNTRGLSSISNTTVMSLNYQFLFEDYCVITGVLMFLVVWS